MAELLRIQPQAPNLDPGQVRVPVPGGAYVGKGLSDLGETAADVFGRIQYGADKAEATRSALEGAQEFKNILKESANTFADRDEFKIEATARIKEAYQQRLDAASKGAKPLIAANLSNELMQHVGKGGSIDEHYWVKTKDRAAENYIAAKDQLTQAAIGADEENQRAAGRMFGDLVGDMTRSNYMTKEKGADELVHFRKTVESESMNLEAAANPADFVKKQQEGAYKGRDSTAVQKALDIASRVGDARARKDAAEMKLASEAAERSAELAASERKLNIPELRETAKTYGWPDEKTNGLIKMQVGLTAANPYEVVAIRDAMKSVDNVAQYNMNDIMKADRALTAAAKGGQVDARTPEYIAAVRHLQTLRANLNITGDIQARHSTFDARQTVQDLYKEYPVRTNSKRQKEAADAERGRALREVTELPPAEQRGYVDKLQKKLEKQHTESPTRNVPLDNLRSIPRR